MSDTVPGADWTAFADALAAELARLPEAGYLVLVEPGVADLHFVQFAQDVEELRAETAGAVAAGPLPVRDERLLTAVGWRPPPPGDYDTNWWQTLPWPATGEEYQRLAAAVVTALRDVQEVGSPAALTYRAWRTGGRPLEVTLPGIKPDQA